jgi:hypothetical protein
MKHRYEDQIAKLEIADKSVITASIVTNVWNLKFSQQLNTIKSPHAISCISVDWNLFYSGV